RELHYIFDNSDSEAIIFDSEFRDQVTALESDLPKVNALIETFSDDARPNSFLDYEALVTNGDDSPLGIERSEDDMLLLYTGGTTGMPKGVMWTQGILIGAMRDGARTMGPLPESPQEHVAAIGAAAAAGILPRMLPACPIMHGTGLFTAFNALANGGTVITLPTKERFVPAELFEAVTKHKVSSIVIVGDVFAKPMLEELDKNAGNYDLSSIATITSSGIMWSTDVKQALINHIPQAIMVDAFGSSEAIGFGTSMMSAAGEVKTSKFTIGEHAKVFKEDGTEVVPGSGEAGFMARGGNVPLGYYKDEKKSAETFKIIDGKRWSMPGDWCTVEEDGTVTLLGRGSVCINSGGEKIYPEEVEEVLKEHPDVDDALVVGVPDEKWGQSVTAVVQPVNGAQLSEEAMREHVRASLAAYKSPKRVLMKENLGRAPNGKADYKGITAFAKAELGIDD
ncbi:MAG: AMP-binding protein, partial [Alphaproteobacteria bacterium]